MARERQVLNSVEDRIEPRPADSDYEAMDAHESDAARAILRSDKRLAIQSPSLRGGYDRDILANSLIAFLFGITGPLVVLIAVSSTGGLSEADMVSWICVSYGLGGLLSIVFSLVYRQPLMFHFSLPGTVLLGPALDHLGFAEVVGAYLVTGVVVALIGLTGCVRRLMSAIPMPIVMAMVAGVFLPFGLKIVSAFQESLWIALTAVTTFIIISMIPRLARYLPPVFAALITGVVATAGLGALDIDRPIVLAIAVPNLYVPIFSIRAITELVVPLTVTVVAINNAQSFGILRNAGYDPPENSATVVCGLSSIAFGVMGSVPVCMPGVMLGIINGTGERSHRYLAGVVTGALFLLFGLFAPSMTGLALALPATFIGMLGGLALIGILRNSFNAAFNGAFTMGALATFMVTISEVTIFNIGAPFWGLVIGCFVSWTLERVDFRGLRAASEQQ